MKTCRSCNIEYPLSTEYFYSNGYTPNGTKKWKPTCKSCENSERKDSYEKLISEVFPILECQVCGYNKCKAALEFHHLDPTLKEYQVSTFQSSRRNKELVLAELRKCVLLCSNCHRELHAGLINLGG